MELGRFWQAAPKVLAFLIKAGRINKGFIKNTFKLKALNQQSVGPGSEGFINWSSGGY